MVAKLQALRCAKRHKHYTKQLAIAFTLTFNNSIKMEILDWIQNYFKNNCDGDWEHSSGIQITTLDNPGWDVEIDISNTSLANFKLEWILNENGKQDWYGVKIENQKFNASGDSGKLKFLLGLFKDMIDKIENNTIANNA
jgi:hypothetical protein